MKLSTGKKPFKIEFDTGDVETIFFNPTDPDFVEKLSTLIVRVSEKVQNMDDVEIDNSGEPVNDTDISHYVEIRDVLYKEIDRTFNSNVSEKVFKHCSAFAVIDGKFFVEQFVEAIVPEIENEIIKENEKMGKHIAEFVNK